MCIFFPFTDIYIVEVRVLCNTLRSVFAFECPSIRQSAYLSVRTSVRPSVSPPFSKIFSSETAWPIKAKFYVEPPWEGGTKVKCINGPGHGTKMANTPTYGKNPSKIFYSGTGGPISMKLSM